MQVAKVGSPSWVGHSYGLKNSNGSVQNVSNPIINSKYNLNELRRVAIDKLIEFRLWQHVKVLLPLCLLHRYYYFRHKLRNLLIGA